MGGIHGAWQLFVVGLVGWLGVLQSCMSLSLHSGDLAAWLAGEQADGAYECMAAPASHAKAQKRLSIWLNCIDAVAAQAVNVHSCCTCHCGCVGRQLSFWRPWLRGFCTCLNRREWHNGGRWVLHPCAAAGWACMLTMPGRQPSVAVRWCHGMP